MNWPFHQHFNFILLRLFNLGPEQVFLFWLNSCKSLVVIIIKDKFWSVYFCSDWDWWAYEVIWLVRVPVNFDWVWVFWNDCCRLCLHKNSSWVFIPTLSYWFDLYFFITYLLRHRVDLNILHLLIRWWELFFFIKVSFIVIVILSVKNVKLVIVEMV